MRGYLYLIAIIICLIAFGYWANSERIKERKEKKEKISILESKEQIFQNKQGEWASSVKVWSLKYSELEKANSKNKALRSDYEQKLAEAYKEIESYKRKNKDLERYISYQFGFKDTIYLPLNKDCFIPPYRSKHLDIDFLYNHPDTIGIIPEYRNNMNTLITLYPKRKANGKKHWPNWAFIWGYDDNSITTSEDPKARITNQISIKFKK